MTEFEKRLAEGIAEQVRNPSRHEKDLAKEVGKQVRNARSREAVVLFLVLVGAFAFLLFSVAR